MHGPIRLKHQWSLSHNFLSGITFPKWIKLLHEEADEIDLEYYPRVAFITLMSLYNSMLSYREKRLYQQKIEEVHIEKDPIFILGHWRSGTTHLHQLLAQDIHQFNFPNTYQVINPETFLTSEAFNTRWFARFLPQKRPMDNVALSFQSPQEDEFAPALLSLKSSYFGISFPRKEKKYEKYLSFKNATHEERESWKKSMLMFTKKLTFKNPKQLILKSPTHTARIQLILELFPNAKFVHIHRNPFEVFQSFRHFYDTAMWYSYLQIPEIEKIEDRILERYVDLYDAYFEDLNLIPAGNFCEVSFHDLESNPESTVQSIYQTLQLSGWSSMRPLLRTYLDQVQHYEKNQFQAMAPSQEEKIKGLWAKHYQKWGY